MSIFSRLFERKNNLTISSDIKKKDARSRNIAFVDTEVGLKDHKIHDIGALRYDGATFHQASQTALNSSCKKERLTISAVITSFITMPAISNSTAY